MNFHKKIFLAVGIFIVLFGCSKKPETTIIDPDTINKIISTIKENDKKSLEKLITKENINQRDSSGITILNHAIRTDNIELVTLLLNKGADPDFQNEDSYQSTPLMVCSNNSQINIAKLLLTYGADVDIQDKNGDPVIHWTAYYGDTLYTQLLLDNKARTDLKSIHSDGAMQVALKEYQFAVVDLLLRNNISLNTVTEKDEKFINAVLKQFDKYLKRNLDAETVNTRDGAGNTLLMIAAQNGFYNIADILIENKVSVNEINPVGQTALNLAVYNGHIDVVDLLLEHGADVNKTDSRFAISPLAAAARQNRVTIAQTLLAHGADINSVDGINNFTPLIWAVLYGHTNFVKLLLDYDPDLTIVSKYESTVFDMTNDEEILKLLNEAK